MSDLKSAADIIADLSLTSLDESSGIKFEDFKNIQYDLSSNPLIEGLIDLESFALLVGEPNVGKTFVALDIALSIARGKSWLGRKVEQGAVLYLAGEGGRNIKKRIEAYKRANGLLEGGLPFRLAYGSIDLCSSNKDFGQIIKIINNMEKVFNQPIRLVVIDTLSRALSGGDENASADMGTFVKTMDLIRQATGVTVIVVHHPGKDTNKGARGHSLLKGAIDTELVLTKNPKGQILVSIKKQRDYEIDKPMCLELKQVIWEDATLGGAHTSCVVKEAQIKNSEKGTSNLTQVPQKGWKSLQMVALQNTSDDINLEDWRKLFCERFYPSSSRQTRSSAFKAVKEALVKEGLIEISGTIVRIIKNASESPVLSESEG